MRIGIGGWSFHRAFQSGNLTLLDFPQLAVKEFGVARIELNSPFFESLQDDYLNTIRERADSAGVRIAHIAVDDSDVDLASLDDPYRRQSVSRSRRWFDVARTLDVPAFRVNTGGSNPPTEPEIAASIESFKELAVDAERSGVKVTIENHNGISADADAILRLLHEVDTPLVGTCPDFGNFPPENRYDQIAKVAPCAVVAHAKMFDFDEHGNETTIDVPRAVEILADAGFDGDLLIEFEGKDDEMEGTRKSLRLLRRVLEGRHSLG